MRVLIAEHQHELYAARLRQSAPALEFCAGNQLSELSRQAGACEIWLGQPDLLAGLLRQGLQPSWVQSTWAGITPLLAADLPRTYCLTRAVGIFGQLMAEYVLTYMLAHERQLFSRMHSQQQGCWDDRLPQSLSGRRALVVGAGDIGVQVAQVLAVLGVELVGIASQPRQQAPFQLIAPLAQLSELASQADYLINLLPDTPATQDIYNAQLFRQLKPTALFINAGRGTAVVDADLIAALNNGQLAGAVLDVCRQEPLPSADPLWTTAGVILTGHSAAPTLPDAMLELFLHNVRAYQTGMPMRGLVELSRGY
jgi:phosphoglycerate dehydrogenase-like enzyme